MFFYNGSLYSVSWHYRRISISQQGCWWGGGGGSPLPTGVTYVTEKHFLIVKGTLTHLTLCIIRGKAGRGGGEGWYGPGRGWGLVFEKVRLEWVAELCVCSEGRVRRCFVVFAEQFRGAGPNENSSLLEWGVWGLGAEVIYTKSAGKADDGRVREGGRV